MVKSNLCFSYLHFYPEDIPRWVLGLTENDLAYQNVLTRVTSGTTNPCKSGLWDVLLIQFTLTQSRVNCIEITIFRPQISSKTAAWIFVNKVSYEAFPGGVVSLVIFGPNLPKFHYKNLPKFCPLNSIQNHRHAHLQSSRIAKPTNESSVRFPLQGRSDFQIINSKQKYFYWLFGTIFSSFETEQYLQKSDKIGYRFIFLPFSIHQK